MILIADAHINEIKDRQNDFFELLDLISTTSEDLVFLGDIFELWFAIPRFEETYQRKFLDWCKKEKQNRKIVYIEGNHEFFLSEELSEYFTVTDPLYYLDKDSEMLFMHGDMINEKDKKYRFFRWLTKNRVVKFLLRYLPFAKKIVAVIKHRLINRNKQRGYLPEELLNSFFADLEQFGNPKKVFLGHFHCKYDIVTKEGALHAISDFMYNEELSVLKNDGSLHTIHWKKLLEIIDK